MRPSTAVVAEQVKIEAKRRAAQKAKVQTPLSGAGSTKGRVRIQIEFVLDYERDLDGIPMSLNDRNIIDFIRAGLKKIDASKSDGGPKAILPGATISLRLDRRPVRS